jgi:3-oxoacyl-[acyl-carrier protein] reductase
MSYETSGGRLNDRLALVTGAGSGIGKAIAEGLANAGAYVVGTGTKSSSVEAVDQALGERGNGVLLDLGGDPEEISDVLKGIVEADTARRHDARQEVSKRLVTILVNNGGVKADGPTARMTDEALDEVINVNLKGTMRLTREVVRTARKEPNVRVITIGSVASVGHAFQASYSASKAGLVGFTRSLVGEQNTPGAPDSTATFNVIEPGLVDTEIIKTIPQEMLTGMVDRIPARRIGAPEDVARLAVFLALPDSGYINGAVIPIDGGATAGINLGI